MVSDIICIIFCLGSKTFPSFCILGHPISVSKHVCFVLDAVQVKTLMTWKSRKILVTVHDSHKFSWRYSKLIEFCYLGLFRIWTIQKALKTAKVINKEFPFFHKDGTNNVLYNLTILLSTHDPKFPWSC